MYGRDLPMCGRPLPRLGRLDPKCERTFSGARRRVPMLANVSFDTYEEGAMRGRSVSPLGRSLRKLCASHPRREPGRSVLRVDGV